MMYECILREVNMSTVSFQATLKNKTSTKINFLDKEDDLN